MHTRANKDSKRLETHTPPVKDRCFVKEIAVGSERRVIRIHFSSHYVQEESVVTTGGVGTNSELSQVLDILDEAAGDARPVHPTPSRVENGSAADDTSAGRSVAPPS